MERTRVIALRDFAIEHYPRAAKLPKTLPPNDYHMSLYGIAVLVPPTSAATVLVAATLLREATTLLTEWDTPLDAQDQRHVEAAAGRAALELCTLTNTHIPWLSLAVVAPEPTMPEPAPEKDTSLNTKRPPEGVNLTTKDAAALLNVKPQTMYVWSSTGSGPLQPVPTGQRLGWRSDDVLALMDAGWVARGRLSKR